MLQLVRVPSAKLEEVAGRLGRDAPSPNDEPASPARPKRRPTGRRTLRDLPLPEERIVVIDPLLDGKAERMGAEETCQMVWRRGGFPHWPRDRYLELCPRDWRATKARLNAAQLEAELGPLDVPPAPSSEQPTSR
jgi:hypothetical protein